MNIKRFEKVIKFLRKPATHKKFNFARVVDTYSNNKINEKVLRKNYDCGATFCVCGLLPNIDPDAGIFFEPCPNGTDLMLRDSHGNDGYIKVAMHYFDISEKDAEYLFTPIETYDESDSLYNPNMLSEKATTLELADHLENFVNKQTPLCG